MCRTFYPMHPRTDKLISARNWWAGRGGVGGRVAATGRSCVVAAGGGLCRCARTVGVAHLARRMWRTPHELHACPARPRTPAALLTCPPTPARRCNVCMVAPPYSHPTVPNDPDFGGLRFTLRVEDVDHR